MLQINKRELQISCLIKLIAIVASIYGMIKSYSGAMFFTYFTNLSNIFIDIVLLIFLFYQIQNRKISQMMYVTKFMATISITLTCFVYMLLLAPTNEAGFLGAYFHNGAGSFCVHLLNPVLAIIDFLYFDKEYCSSQKHVFYAIVPPLIYVGYVLVLGQCFHMRWDKAMLAPYNFLNYGAETGWFGFDLSLFGSTTLGIGSFYMIIVLILIFVGLGSLFLKMKRKV